MLDMIRDGAMDADSVAWLNRHTVGPHPASHAAITLTMTNAQAKAMNDRHLTALPGQAQIFIGLREGDIPQLPTEEVLTLKIDARVMLIANDPAKRWVETRLVANDGRAAGSRSQMATEAGRTRMGRR